MQLQSRASLSLFLGALLAPAISAQPQLQVHAVTSTVRDAGTYHVASESWTRANSNTAIGSAVLYNNTGQFAYFAGMTDNSVSQFEITDTGRLPSSSDVGFADDYIVDGIKLAYCTEVGGGPGAVVGSWGFDQQHAPCGGPGAQASGSFDLTALPTGNTPGALSCWIMTVDLAGSGSPVFLADGNGSFDNDLSLDSFGYTISYSGQGASTTTGPIIFGDPIVSPFGDGTTNFGFGPGPDGTGLGQQDFFWLENPALVSGCFFFGGYPSGAPWASFYMRLFGDAGSACSCGPYCGDNSANSVGPGAALLSAANWGTPNATFDITGIPNEPGIIFSGPNQVDLAFGCGRLCVAGGVVRGSVQFPSGNSLLGVHHPMTGINDKVQYWYRDPANLSSCGAAFNLSGALRH